MAGESRGFYGRILRTRGMKGSAPVRGCSTGCGAAAAIESRYERPCARAIQPNCRSPSSNAPWINRASAAAGMAPASRVTLSFSASP